jgi:hypothetical protein
MSSRLISKTLSPHPHFKKSTSPNKAEYENEAFKYVFKKSWTKDSSYGTI